MGRDTYADEDEDDDDGIYSFLLHFRLKNFNMHNIDMMLLCYFIIDEDLEVDMAWLHGLIR